LKVVFDRHAVPTSRRKTPAGSGATAPVGAAAAAGAMLRATAAKELAFSKPSGVAGEAAVAEGMEAAVGSMGLCISFVAVVVRRSSRPCIILVLVVAVKTSRPCISFVFAIVVRSRPCISFVLALIRLVLTLLSPEANALDAAI